MNLTNSLSRLTMYCKRHGLRATVGRGAQAAIRTMFSNRMVLFYFDLAADVPGPADTPHSVGLERKKNETEIGQPDLEEFVNFWNPKIAREQMRNRFRLGAWLWLLKADGRLAGYGWTMRGRTIEPHFFPLADDDVHLFDYYVAPAYRGRGFNPLLVNHILRYLASDGPGRAFIEAAEWNHAQLSSLTKTPFRLLGYARKLTIRSQTIVWWDIRRTTMFHS